MASNNNESFDIDLICAQLTDIFGDHEVSPEQIYQTGIKCKWNLSECIEELFKSFDNKKEEDMDGAVGGEDVVIESEANFGDQRKEIAQNYGAVKKWSLVDVMKANANTNFEDTTHRKPNKPESKTNYMLKKLEDCPKTLIIMRGMPGSGKSYLAREVIEKLNKNPVDHIFSADDFFCDPQGNYKYDKNLIPQAHLENITRLTRAMQNNVIPLVFDNTNMKLWEMQDPCRLAVNYGYRVELLWPNNYWSMSPARCSERNIHNVPLDKLKVMKANFEVVRGSDELLKYFGLAQPKPEPVPKTNTTVIPEEKPSTSIRSEFKPNIDWQSHEKELEEFWNDEEQEQTLEQFHFPKPQRRNPNAEIQPPGQVGNNIISLLKDNGTKPETLKNKPKLEKHRKGCRNENESFLEIRSIFPDKSIDHLWDLFENCNGDAEWMSNILLNENLEENNASASNADRDFECGCDDGRWNDEEDQASALVVEEEETKAQVLPQRQRQKKRLKVLTEDEEQMKRNIEEKFVLGEEFYSDHMKKIRDFRRYGPQAAPENVNTESAIEDVELEEETGNDEDFEGGEEEVEEEDHELLEIELGEKLVHHLETIFNTNSDELSDFKQLKTNVFMPKSLAKQIYMLWVESMFNQQEEQKQTAAKDDEEIARTLQSSHQVKPPSEDKRWSTEVLVKSVMINDLKSIYTLKKLYGTFPDVDQNTVKEVFAASGFKYDNTVTALNNMIKKEKTEVQPNEESKFKPSSPVPDSYADLDNNSRIFTPKVKDSHEVKRQALQEFEDNRNMAMHHHQMKMECIQKARDAVQKRTPDVAQYYSEMSHFHRSKIDHFNHLAANCIINVNDLRHQNPELLDLHHLLVQEALPCLEVFLDSHIRRLRAKKQAYKSVFIITGRGLHSINGIATIKFNVQNYLKRRGLSYVEVNPGLLKVKIYNQSRFTYVHDE